MQIRVDDDVHLDDITERITDLDELDELRASRRRYSQES